MNGNLSIEFVRLFFKSSVEEEVAYRWAARLEKLVGIRVAELRPETTLAEMMNWAKAVRAEPFDFVVVFEPELRMEFDEFLEDADQCTFREMVERYAQRFEGAI